ncbi:hypothetical protein ABBQ32_012271 [Trebouxia sp. C0010 RCD-2024]
MSVAQCHIRSCSILCSARRVGRLGHCENVVRTAYESRARGFCTHRTTDQASSRPVLASSGGIGNTMLAGLKKAFTKEPSESVEQGASSSFTDSGISWDDLQKKVQQRQAELQWETPDLENGPANARALKRSFGKGSKPVLKLYRDHAAWCPYCQKVWIQLEEKQIPYEIEKINMRCYGDKPAAYTAKVPSGLLPAMELDGELYTESDLIMQVLEERFPEKPLMPSKGAPTYHRAQKLLRLERQLFGVWLQWLCRSWSHKDSMETFMDTMEQVNAELEADGGPFFLGKELSLVDCVFAPFLERIVASIPYYKGVRLRGDGRFPNLERWFEAMEQKPSYLGTRSDFFTHVHDLPPQLGGCVSVKDARPMADAIDGDDGISWHLPLPPLDASSLEPYSPGEEPEMDRLRAVQRLVENHEAVTKFAARGCGQQGSPPVNAPLSDPYAKPGMQHLAAVDAGLRHVALALLDGPEAAAKTLHAGMNSAANGNALPGAPVCASAAYLRNRVGVPRDLPLPAARQLRAHLNWLIDELRS